MKAFPLGRAAWSKSEGSRKQMELRGSVRLGLRAGVYEYEKRLVEESE